VVRCSSFLTASPVQRGKDASCLFTPILGWTCRAGGEVGAIFDPKLPTVREPDTPERDTDVMGGLETGATAASLTFFATTVACGSRQRRMDRAWRAGRRSAGCWRWHSWHCLARAASRMLLPCAKDARSCSRVHPPLQCNKRHHRRNSERTALAPTPITSIATGIKGPMCLPRWLASHHSRPSPWNLPTSRRHSPRTRPTQALPPPSPIRRSRSWPMRQSPRRRPFASTSCLTS